MKKNILLFSFVLLFTFLVGCTNFFNDNSNGNNSNNTSDNNTNTNTNENTGTNDNNTNTNDGNASDNKTNEDSTTQLLKIEDYYPIKENVKYVYEGNGNEYASYNVYVDYTSENKVQQRVDNGGTVIAKVIEINDGKVTRLLSRAEAYYRENLLEAKGDDVEVLLMEPLVKGTSWKLDDSRIRKITNTSVKVETPSGSYDAIEVTTEGSNDKTIDYYAKNVGLVKSVFISGGTEVTSSLSKIEENVSLTQNISFFYPNINDNKIYYIDKDITFNTNDITRLVLESSYKDAIGKDLGKVFNTNTKINSLYLNKDGMVYIDLNKAFVTEMNAGSGYESMILKSIANTLGKYYGSQKVILTIDSNLYESGHIAMKKGEFIEVNYNDSIKVK